MTSDNKLTTTLREMCKSNLLKLCQDEFHRVWTECELDHELTELKSRIDDAKGRNHLEWLVLY